MVLTDTIPAAIEGANARSDQVNGERSQNGAENDARNFNRSSIIRPIKDAVIELSLIGSGICAMQKEDSVVISQLIKYSIAGAFSAMVGVAAILVFDISSVGTLLSSATNQLHANLFFGGAMLKGSLIGAALGSASLHRRSYRATHTIPNPSGLNAVSVQNAA